MSISSKNSLVTYPLVSDIVMGASILGIQLEEVGWTYILFECNGILCGSQSYSL